MNTGLHRIDVTGAARLLRVASRPGISGGLSARPEGGRGFTPGFVALLAVLATGLGAWLLSGYGSNTAESEPVHLATAVATEPPPTSSPDDVALDLSLPNPAAPPAEAPPAVEAAPVEGLKISSQSWRRGGLGSKALVTFTLRNGNDYGVKDIEIRCAFARRDGSHVTDRSRTIHDTVKMKSQKTFARLHIGFVNINANQAKCSLITASRI